ALAAIGDVNELFETFLRNYLCSVVGAPDSSGFESSPDGCES
ncbi:MAG: hypothetical protein QOE48_2184, partial [Mycobacterium sp.]|nr:hypothetical protein [Mycobacterium sp.]